MWPSIKEAATPQIYDEDYVMQLEEERGHQQARAGISYTADDSHLPMDGDSKVLDPTGMTGTGRQ